jgi:hypothetical protein
MSDMDRTEETLKALAEQSMSLLADLTDDEIDKAKDVWGVQTYTLIRAGRTRLDELVEAYYEGGPLPTSWQVCRVCGHRESFHQRDMLRWPCHFLRVGNVPCGCVGVAAQPKEAQP